MAKVSDILTTLGLRVQEAWSLSPEQVFFDPLPVELPETGDFACLRASLTAGRRETGGYDVMVLTVDIAADLEDPGYPAPESAAEERLAARMGLIDLLRAQVTPWGGGVVAEIPGYEEPFVAEALVSPVDDAPGRLVVGLMIQGEVSLPRGGYEG
jgi:hypothetical protein